MSSENSNCIHCNGYILEFKLCDECLENPNVSINVNVANEIYNSINLTYCESYCGNYYIPHVYKSILIKEIDTMDKNDLLNYPIDIKDITNLLNDIKSNKKIVKYHDGSIDKIIIIDYLYNRIKRLRTRDEKLKKRIERIKKYSDKVHLYGKYEKELNIYCNQYINKEISFKVFKTNFKSLTKRYNGLRKKLEIKGMKLRNNSKLCNNYIINDIIFINDSDFGTIDNVDDIVDFMESMDFLFNCTDYKIIITNLLKNKKGIVSNKDIIKEARLESIEQWLQNVSNSCDILPKRLLDFYNNN